VNLLKLVIIIIALLGISIAAIAYLATPFIWVYLLWCATLTICYKTAQKTNLKEFIVFLSCNIVLLLGLETYGLIKEVQKQPKITFSDVLYTANEVLGRTPIKNHSVKSIKTYDGEPLYDIIYTIDKNGLRIAPPIVSDQCILFFGGSFTFGYGVEDNQTAAWLVGESLNSRTLNFGVSGYGPHQMLARIDSEDFTEIVDCEPTTAVYLLLSSHITRSAGRVYWDLDGPRYELNARGDVIHTGKFRDHWSPLRKKYEGAKPILNKSAAFRHYFGHWAGSSLMRDHEDEELLAGIIATSEKQLKATYPDIVFFVVSWDGKKEKLDELINDKIAARGVELHLLSETIPELRDKEARKTIRIPHDGHPTAAGQRKIAQSAVNLNRQKRQGSAPTD
jgi:hypothetical protein